MLRLSTAMPSLRARHLKLKARLREAHAPAASHAATDRYGSAGLTDAPLHRYSPGHRGRRGPAQPAACGTIQKLRRRAVDRLARHSEPRDFRERAALFANRFRGTATGLLARSRPV